MLKFQCYFEYLTLFLLFKYSFSSLVDVVVIRGDRSRIQSDQLVKLFVRVFSHHILCIWILVVLTFLGINEPIRVTIILSKTNMVRMRAAFQTSSLAS